MLFGYLRIPSATDVNKMLRDEEISDIATEVTCETKIIQYIHNNGIVEKSNM